MTRTLKSSLAKISALLGAAAALTGCGGFCQVAGDLAPADCKGFYLSQTIALDWRPLAGILPGSASGDLLKIPPPIAPAGAP